ncbi:MAG TPA: ribosomal L7Ae/L30e/S12e/Gadd45 family protein [Clostridiales bacterium]|nr:ribosomal L7Ae/L30e/S12e/Gadd45 family protein [Clostridiales bacterium]
MNNKQLLLLGLCRRAGRLSMGHDACLESIKDGQAKLCLLTADSSDRLKNEFAREIDFYKKDIPLICSSFSFDDIKKATGRPAGVLTINDEGFAGSFLKLEENQNGR